MSNCLFDSESDYDDEPVRGKKLLSTFNLGICSSNSDGSVQKRLTTLPIKRPFDDNNNSFHTSVKKPKVYVRRLVDRPFSVRMKENIKREFDMVAVLIRNCERMKNVEELKLQSLERDVKERSNELLNKKKQVGCVRRISQYYTKMQSKIEKCVKDLEEKEAPVCLIEDLIKNYKHELKKNEIELRKIEANNDKDGGRKRSSRLLRKKIDKSSKEIKTKEEEFDALKIFVSGKIEELQSEMCKLSKVMDKRNKRRTDQHDQMKDFESMKKQFEDRVTELDSKEKQCDRWLKELDSNEKHFKVQAKELESKQEKFEGRVKEIKSKEEAFEGRVKEFESKEEEFKVQVKVLEIKKSILKAR